MLLEGGREKQASRKLRESDVSLAGTLFNPPSPPGRLAYTAESS